MRRYEFLDKSTMRCIHFVKRSTSNALLEEQVEAAKRAGVVFTYWNYLEGGRESSNIADPLGVAVGLEHAPYGRPWLQFLDDLITLAYRYNGLVIVVDRADVLIAEKSDEMFNLIEAFQVQFHHWFDQEKPCHLCFQVEEDEHATKLIKTEASAAR